MDVVIIVLGIVIVVLQVVLLTRKVNVENTGNSDDNKKLISKLESENAVLSSNMQNLSASVDTKISALSLQMNTSMSDINAKMADMQISMENRFDKGIHNFELQHSKFTESLTKEVAAMTGENTENFARINSDLKTSILEISKENNNSQRDISDTLQNRLDKIEKSSSLGMSEMQKEVTAKLISMLQENKSNQEAMQRLLEQKLQMIQESTDTKLTHIHDDVNKKLDNSLNERLDKSFDRVAKQLSDLYQSLGQLNEMQSGIDSLNKTLSNVKTRGTWGEIQLERILEETMQEGQYEKNYRSRKGSRDVVEFAVKIPSKEDNNTFIYLPIDSKFPADIYNKIVEASNAANKEDIDSAIKELAQRIREEARTISDKYIDPPTTTDFAIMFLPTESLYAEVLKIGGLVEECQTKYRVVISGPSTITALLMSLQIGFRNLVLAKKTEEIRNILEAVKAQYSKLSDLIDKTSGQLERAMKSTGDLKSRTEMIQKKMASIHALETTEESDAVLNIEAADEDDE